MASFPFHRIAPSSHVRYPHAAAGPIPTTSAVRHRLLAVVGRGWVRVADPVTLLAGRRTAHAAASAAAFGGAGPLLALLLAGQRSAPGVDITRLPHPQPLQRAAQLDDLHVAPEGSEHGGEVHAIAQRPLSERRRPFPSASGGHAATGARRPERAVSAVEQQRESGFGEEKQGGAYQEAAERLHAVHEGDAVQRGGGVYAEGVGGDQSDLGTEMARVVQGGAGEVLRDGEEGEGTAPTIVSRVVSQR